MTDLLAKSELSAVNRHSPVKAGDTYEAEQISLAKPHTLDEEVLSANEDESFQRSLHGLGTLSLRMDTTTEKDTDAHHVIAIIHKHLADAVRSDYYPERVSAELLQETVDELLGSSPESAPVAVDIITHNSLNGIEVTPTYGKFVIGAKLKKQRALLNIYARDPDVAEVLVVNHIGGFHASRSGSLGGVIQHGALMSSRELRRRGAVIATGERVMFGANGQEHISFADWSFPQSISAYAGEESPITLQDLRADKIDALRTYTRMMQRGEKGLFTEACHKQIEELETQIHYMEQNPDSLETWLMQANFPIAYGLNTGHYKHAENWYEAEQEKHTPTIVKQVNSDVQGEFWVKSDAVPLAELPVIAVPKSKLKIVRTMLTSYGYPGAEVVDISVITGELK